MLTTARHLRSPQTLFRVEPAEISAVVVNTVCDSAPVCSNHTTVGSTDAEIVLNRLTKPGATESADLLGQINSCHAFREEIAIHDSFVRLLAKAGYSFKNMTCEVDQSRIVLNGTVCRYYHLQMAIQTAQKVGKGRQIISQIEVGPTPDTDLRADNGGDA